MTLYPVISRGPRLVRVTFSRLQQPGARTEEGSKLTAARSNACAQPLERRLAIQTSSEVECFDVSSGESVPAQFGPPYFGSADAVAAASSWDYLQHSPSAGSYLPSCPTFIRFCVIFGDLSGGVDSDRRRPTASRL